MKGIKQAWKIISNWKTNKQLCVLATIFIFFLYVGCAPSWIPSDNNANALVRAQYLFFGNGEAVQTTVEKRGEYIKECKCYPIKFIITFSNGRINTKTFYFYKNESGNVALKEFVGLNHISL